jgi:hypothetical protein
VTGNCRKQHNEELRDTVTELKFRGRDGRGTYHVFGKTRSKYRILLGKFGGDKPLGKQRQRWNDDIKMDHKEKRWVRVTGIMWLRIRISCGIL